MQAENEFKVCRVCLSSETSARLVSLFEKRSVLMSFALVTGVDIQQDKNKHDAMICESCLKQFLTFWPEFWKFRKATQKNEQSFFQQQRSLPEAQINLPEPEGLNNLETGKEGSRIDSLLEVLEENDQVGANSKSLKRSRGVETRNKTRQESKDHQKTPIEGSESFSLDSFEMIDEREPQVIAGNIRKKGGKLPAQCKTCHKMLSDRNHLKRHVEAVHKKIKNFSCEMCSYSCYGKESIRIHRIYAHSTVSYEERPFVCNIQNCGKRFKNQTQLEIHVKNVHGERRRCPVCRKNMKPDSLRKHVLHFHKKVE